MRYRETQTNARFGPQTHTPRIGETILGRQGCRVVGEYEEQLGRMLPESGSSGQGSVA